MPIFGRLNDYIVHVIQLLAPPIMIKATQKSK